MNQKNANKSSKVAFPKKKYRADITKMHYIEPLIVLMMGKMLKGEVFKT